MRPTIVISSPVDTFSGYGARSRDFIQAVIDLDKYDVKLLSQRWGNTRFGYLSEHSREDLSSLIIPKLDSKPDIWVQITVPNEFQAVGNYNIGVTAGIESTLCDQSWIQGLNRMDLTLTSSEHSKTVFTKTKWELKDNRTGQVQNLQIQKPVEVLFEGVDISKYFQTKSNIDLSTIKESFCFLVVGHWLQGSMGHDRKNIGYTVKSFLETFKNKPTQPALILKTSHVTTSLSDKDMLLNKIDNIKKTVKPKTAKPATPSPITVPPPKEILSAFGKLVRAACVVLTLVLVAIFIPIFPAKAENTAPKTKAMTINQCVVGTIKDTAVNKAATITTNTANSLYSAFKNAKAPS